MNPQDLRMLVLLDSSTTDEEGGPYVADAYCYSHGTLVAEESRGYILATDIETVYGHEIGQEVLVCHTDECEQWVVPSHDVAEAMSLSEARSRLLLLREAMGR